MRINKITKDRALEIFHLLHNYQNEFKNDRQNKELLFYFQSDMLLKAIVKEYGNDLIETIVYFFGKEYHLIISSPRCCFEGGILSELKELV